MRRNTGGDLQSFEVISRSTVDLQVVLDALVE
jgi:hypothetical protein